MSNWIIRCANPRCCHVGCESEWVLIETDPELNIQEAHCPKCNCKSFYKATTKEIASLNAQSARVEAAVAAE